MLLEPLMMARSFTTLAKSLTKAGGGIAETSTRGGAAEAIRQQASVEARVAAAEADPNVTDLSKALAAVTNSGQTSCAKFSAYPKTR
jgi:hypothetical protein